MDLIKLTHTRTFHAFNDVAESPDLIRVVDASNADVVAFSSAGNMNTVLNEIVVKAREFGHVIHLDGLDDAKPTKVFEVEWTGGDAPTRIQADAYEVIGEWFVFRAGSGPSYTVARASMRCVRSIIRVTDPKSD